MGEYLKAGFKDLQQRHECIGNARSRGLLMGVELVVDRESKAPAPELTASVSRR
jgi:4-aminobutyrate aminotransferase-like enzyme